MLAASPLTFCVVAEVSFVRRVGGRAHVKRAADLKAAILAADAAAESATAAHVNGTSVAMTKPIRN